MLLEQLRDLVYQQRFTESFRLIQYTQDLPVKKHYLHTHSQHYTHTFKTMTLQDGNGDGVNLEFDYRHLHTCLYANRGSSLAYLYRGDGVDCGFSWAYPYIGREDHEYQPPCPWKVRK